ncbi:MAG: hemolysin family protein [Longicatena sp.]
MDSIPQQILLQVFLILVNAFFASTEIAVISLNPTKLKMKAEQGEKTAIRLLKLTEEPAGFLSTIQIGITLAGFLGSAFAADNFSGYLVDWVYYGLGFTTISLSILDTIAVIVITLILSYFTLVFGELVPKRIAMQKPYEVAKISCGVVRGVAVIMHPLVVFLSFSTNLILKLLHMKTEAEEESVTEEEIRMMVNLGGENGAIDESEKEWIQNVFAFDDTSIREIMTHSADVIYIDLHDSEEDILMKIRKHGLSRFPVCGDDLDDVAGVLYTRDYLIASSEERKELQTLLRPAYFVPETIAADDLFKDMQHKKVHFAVVVDEFGEVSGIITMEDLLEEIVGNIYDEYDHQEDHSIEKISDTKWKIVGDCDIQEVMEETNMPLIISNDYDTIGGYIFSKLRSIPKDGTTFDVEDDGWLLHVTKVEDRRIREILVEQIKVES